MFPVMVRRKLSYCPCWTGSNAHRRPVLVGRGAETVVDIDFDPVRVDLVERPCRLASDRSTGMYRGKLRPVLDRTKLQGSRGDAEW
jgi:hypothetical protein